MIELGNYNTLHIERSTSVGLFLADEEGTEVLLPNKFVPENYSIGDKIKIFCYLDNEERPVATTQIPKITRNRFGYLRVVDVNRYGAFMDWGLDKQLFVPFSEQAGKLRLGQEYVIFCYLDEQTFRLAASSRISNFLNNQDVSLKEGDPVDLLVYRKTELGWEVIIDHKHQGLLFHSDVYGPIAVGECITGYIKKIRTDKKIDVVLQPQGIMSLEPAADKIYAKLVESNGYLGLHDKSPAEDIYQELNMSKKTFKRAIGNLYKKKKIEIKLDGIYLKKT